MRRDLGQNSSGDQFRAGAERQESGQPLAHQRQIERRQGRAFERAVDLAWANGKLSAHLRLTLTANNTINNDGVVVGVKC